MDKRPISDFKRRTAKRLRENTTAAEDILWRHLRRLEIDGTHFRRQVVIGPYVADFACLARRLIIEVDGSQHGDDAKHPARRSSDALAELGRLSRFAILEQRRYDQD
jgi:very-short-patch-repair endonuclease